MLYAIRSTLYAGTLKPWNIETLEPWNFITLEPSNHGTSTPLSLFPFLGNRKG